MDNSGNIKFYFDAAFAVKKDTRSYTGILMTMETIGAYVQSRKKKLNIKISTKD